MMSCGEQSINMGFNFEVIHSGTISTLAQKINNLDSIKAWSDPNPYQILPIIWKNRQKKNFATHISETRALILQRGSPKIQGYCCQ